jgi:Arc/MetJ-type ribon-helix-helix transcriptional regulator
MSNDGRGSTRIFTGYLRRTRGRACSFTDQRPPPVEEPKPRPAKVALTLALAHRIEAAIERGEYRDRADVARQHGLTRARITQIMDLLLLAPELQERVLGLETTTHSEPITESQVQQVVREARWNTQRSLWADVLCQSGSDAIEGQRPARNSSSHRSPR